MKKILIIRFSSMGDIILTTAFIRACRKKYPASEIFFLTKKKFQDVLKFNPDIKKVFTLGDEPLFDVINQIKNEDIDQVFDLHRNIRSFVAALLLKCRVKRYSKNILKRRILVLTKKFLGKNISIRQRYINCLNKDDKEITNSLTKIYLADEEISRAKEIIKYNEADIYIGINMGARWAAKKWIPENYAELIQRLAFNSKVVVFGDKYDKTFNETVFGQIPESCNKNIIDLTGKLDIRELFACIKLCNRIVTTDSAVMHASQALDIPVVALFGPTVRNFGFWEPRENDKLIEKQVSCRPCSLHGLNICPKKHFKCMRDISVEEVYKAVTLKE
ncbi:glycosyltransferase family 9 protein [bacterium]